jgi:hypothetical protein
MTASQVFSITLTHKGKAVSKPSKVLFTRDWDETLWHYRGDPIEFDFGDNKSVTADGLTVEAEGVSKHLGFTGPALHMSLGDNIRLETLSIEEGR